MSGRLIFRFLLCLTPVAALKTSSTLMDTLMDEFSSFWDARRAAIHELGSDKEAWQARQQQTRHSLSQLFYPLPEPGASPNYTITGTLHHSSGFTVQKLLYETRPGLFVAGSLWVPDALLQEGSLAKAPAIMLVSGHDIDAWRSNGSTHCTGPADNCTGPDPHPGGGVPHPHKHFDANPGGYQLVLWNLVHKGYVALAFDPIGQGERLEYAHDPALESGHAWGSYEHEYLSRQLFLVGRSSASFWLHDEVRSLDLLASLPFVDADNLGVCGCSGGGMAAAYIGSVDPRVKAVSIACYMSTQQVDYEYEYGGAIDGEQTWPRAATLSLDKPDLVQVRAPLPTQVLLTTEDNCFPYDGGVAALNESTAAFEAYGATLSSHSAIYHHGWVTPNREAMYAFFQASLGKPRPEEGAEEWWPSSFGNLSSLFSREQLTVTSTGQVLTAPEARPNLIIHNFTASLVRDSEARLEQRRSETPDAFVEQIARSAADVVGYRAPPTALALGGADEATLPGEGRCRLPVALNGSEGADAVLLIGCEDSRCGELGPRLAQAGYRVIQASVCGFAQGDAAFPGSFKSMAACPDIAQNLNRSIVGVHAADIVRVSSWARGSQGGSRRVLATVVANHLYSAAMHAALLAPGSTGALVALQPIASYADLASSLHYYQGAEWSWIFDVLSHYDLADLSAALSPLPQLVVNAAAANGSALPLDGAERAYAFAADSYARRGHPQAFGIASAANQSAIEALVLRFVERLAARGRYDKAAAAAATE